MSVGSVDPSSPCMIRSVQKVASAALPSSGNGPSKVLDEDLLDELGGRERAVGPLWIAAEIRDQLHVGRESPLGVVPEVLGQERSLVIREGVGGSRELDSHHPLSVGDTTDATSVQALC